MIEVVWLFFCTFAVAYNLDKLCMDSKYENMNLFDFMRLTFNKLVALIKWIFSILLGVVHLCFRYWYVMIICVALGFFAARLWLKPQFTRFKGQTTITFLPGMKQLVEEGLLSFMSQSFETKRDIFELPDATQLAIRGFYTYNVIDARFDNQADYIDKNGKITATDTLSAVMQDRVSVQINLQGCYDFASLEHSLLMWFNGQEQFTSMDKIYREAMTERLEYVNREIARSDSFLTYRYFSEAPKVEIFNDVEMEKKSTLLYNEMLSLIQEKQYLERELKQNPQVINFQTHFYISTKTPKEKYIIGLISGFALGLIVSLVIKYWANIKKFILTK